MNTLNFQRRVLGVLCALLAPCCILFGLLGENLPDWYCSISATYYANSKLFMIGLLFSTAVFFFCYRGYEKKDIVLSLIQAVSAVGIVVFPCKTTGVTGAVGLFSLPVETSHVIHCIVAGTLFTAFATNITFLFTRGNKSNSQKLKRNKVYILCGVIIYVFEILQAMSAGLKVPEWFPLTMINETVMLEAFAVAWLTKSGMFTALNDK